MQKIIDTICAMRNGSADDKQFRATVEYNIDLAIAEREKEIVEMIREHFKTETKNGIKQGLAFVMDGESIINLITNSKK